MRSPTPVEPGDSHTGPTAFGTLVDEAFRLREQRREAQYQKELQAARERLRLKR